MPKSDNSEIAELQTVVKFLQDDIGELKTMVKEVSEKLDSKYVTKEEFDTFKSNQTQQKFLLAALTLTFGSLLGFFIAHIV